MHLHEVERTDHFSLIPAGLLHGFYTFLGFIITVHTRDENIAIIWSTEH